MARHVSFRSRVVRAIQLAGLAWTVTTGGPLQAQEDTAPPPPVVPEESRQFDFWIGDWEVTGPKGRVIGESRVERVLGGRALQEHWNGGGGVAGTSLNVYDASTRTWRQFWVDGSGGVLRLEGGLVGNDMVLQGETRDADGVVVIERITWTPGEDGTVRQLWEKSSDGGATWTVAFDGRYRRRSS